jgi:hypothetical protein
MSRRSSSRQLMSAAVVAAVTVGTGCHNLRSQLSAMTGSTATTTTTTGTTSTRPHILDVWRGPTPILMQTDHSKHGLSAGSDAGRSPALPRFDWTGQTAQGGGAFDDGSVHQRGARSRSGP